MKNMPKEIIEAEKENNKKAEDEQSMQSIEEIMRIIQEARTPGVPSKPGEQAARGGSSADDDALADVESDAEGSGDYLPSA